MQSNQMKRRYKSVALRTRNAPSVDGIVDGPPAASARSNWLVGRWRSQLILQPADVQLADVQPADVQPTDESKQLIRFVKTKFSR